MKLHVKDGVFVDRDQDGNVTLDVTGDLGGVKFTGAEWARLMVAGAPVQDAPAIAAAEALQAHGRVVSKVPDKRILHFEVQFSLESTDDSPMFTRVSEALENFAAHNLENQGSEQTLVTVAGVNFRVNYRNDYYADGVLIDQARRAG